MNNTTARFFGSFTRAGLFLALAASILALTPRTASALVIMCNGNGWCMTLEGGCGQFTGGTGGWTCFSLGPIAIGPITRDANGDASIVIAGKTSALISPSNASAARFKILAERGGSGGDKQATKAFHKELDAVVRSGNRNVSDDDLKKISKAFNLPIKTEPNR